MISILIPAGAAGTRITLDDDELHHLRVRRIELPAEVRFVDGAGRTGTAIVAREGRGAILEVRESSQAPRPATRMLAVGAGDKDRFGWMVEKATELGVTDIVPLALTNARGVSGAVGAAQLDRLRKRARETLKQCGGAWAPVIHPIQELGDFLTAIAAAVPTAAVSTAAVKWIMDPDGGAPGPVALAAGIIAVVGPEGGLTADERARFLDAGFAPIRAGPHILRFETAALAAAVLMQATSQS